MNNKTKEFMDNFKLGVIGSWGKVEWRDDVYPQRGDNLYAGVDLENFAELVRADERNKHAVNGALVMSFFDGGVEVILRINKSVSVTKKGSIIIKDKKGKGK